MSTVTALLKFVWRSVYMLCVFAVAVIMWPVPFGHESNLWIIEHSEILMAAAVSYAMLMAVVEMEHL